MERTTVVRTAVSHVDSLYVEYKQDGEMVGGNPFTLDLEGTRALGCSAKVWITKGMIVDQQGKAAVGFDVPLT